MVVRRVVCGREMWSVRVEGEWKNGSSLSVWTYIPGGVRAVGHGRDYDPRHGNPFPYLHLQLGVPAHEAVRGLAI